MAQGVHKITEQFEQELCRYTGAPYAVAVDNCSNALFLALYYELHVQSHPMGYFTYDIPNPNPLITIPRHTYPSVACEVIHAGGRVRYRDNDLFTYVKEKNLVKGAYSLEPTIVIDSALRFTAGMYNAGTHMCLSFTGPYKHLKLGKGGAILTDDEQAYKWFKKARFSGRAECSYHDDNFDDCPVIGWNFYMLPEIAARGLQMMTQFYNQDGTPKHNEDLCLPYPDLSKFKLWQ
jgi:dTDP-4-amino-4,6-dideoxygalactose transaminase